MKFTSELETLIAIIRVFPPGKTFDDNFTWCCTLKKIDNETCEISGVLRTPNSGEYEAINNVIVNAGFKKVKWLQKENNKYVYKERILENIKNRENYTAEFETIVGMVRIFPENKEKTQTSEFDNWSWCCTLKRIDSITCEICGVLRSPIKDEWKSIIELLKNFGFKKARWLRIVDGKHIWKEYAPKL